MIKRLWPHPPAPGRGVPQDLESQASRVHRARRHPRLKQQPSSDDIGSSELRRNHRCARAVRLAHPAARLNDALARQRNQGRRQAAPGGSFEQPGNRRAVWRAGFRLEGVSRTVLLLRRSQGEAPATLALSSNASLSMVRAVTTSPRHALRPAELAALAFPVPRLARDTTWATSRQPSISAPRNKRATTTKAAAMPCEATTRRNIPTATVESQTTIPDGQTVQGERRAPSHPIAAPVRNGQLTDAMPDNVTPAV